jgi:Zn-finger domain-containing protein
MFSNLTQNSILHVLDLNNNPKVLSGPIESVSLPRPKYNTFNPNMEMIVDITATIAGERREFKGVPNTSIANFGDAAFIIAENKDALSSYITSMMQNSKTILNSMEKHKKLVKDYETALSELNPSVQDNKAIESLQNQVNTLQDSIKVLLEKLNTGSTSN